MKKFMRLASSWKRRANGRQSSGLLSGQWHDFLFDKDGEEKKDAEALGKLSVNTFPQGIIPSLARYHLECHRRPSRHLLKLLKTIVPMID